MMNRIYFPEVGRFGSYAAGARLRFGAVLSRPLRVECFRLAQGCGGGFTDVADVADVTDATPFSHPGRGGSDCLNSFWAAVKWTPALVTPPPGLASAG